MATIETTKIKANNEAGYVIVNVDDAAAQSSEKWTAGKQKAEKPATEKPTDDEKAK